MKTKKYKLGGVEVEGIVTPTSIRLLPTKTNKSVTSLFYQLNRNIYVKQYANALAVLSMIEYKIDVAGGKYKLEIVKHLAKTMSENNKYPLVYIDNSITEVKNRIKQIKQKMKNQKQVINPVTYTGISYYAEREDLAYDLGNAMIILSQLKQIKEKINQLIKTLKT